MTQQSPDYEPDEPDTASPQPAPGAARATPARATPARESPAQELPAQDTSVRDAPIPGGSTQPTPSAPPEDRRVTRAGMVWAAVATALVVMILLIIFILQNQDYVQVRYFGLEGAVPLGIAPLHSGCGWRGARGAGRRRKDHPTARCSPPPPRPGAAGPLSTRGPLVSPVTCGFTGDLRRPCGLRGCHLSQRYQAQSLRQGRRRPSPVRLRPPAGSSRRRRARLHLHLESPSCAQASPERPGCRRRSLGRGRTSRQPVLSAPATA